MRRNPSPISWRLIIAGVALTTAAAAALFGTEGQIRDLAMIGGGILGVWQFSIWAINLDARRLREAG